MCLALDPQASDLSAWFIHKLCCLHLSTPSLWLQRSGLILCFSLRAYLWIRYTHIFICIQRNLTLFSSCRQFLNSNIRESKNTSKRERFFFTLGRVNTQLAFSCGWCSVSRGCKWAKVPMVEKGMFVVCRHVGTPCLISECPPEAYLSLVLWQPDICPHSLLTHEQMRALPSTKWPA